VCTPQRTTAKFNPWIAYDYARTDINGPFLSGNSDQNTIAAGGDMKLSDSLLIGAAFTYSENKGDFGGGSGDYKLKETTGSAYVGYGVGPWYVGAVVGAGDLDFSDVRRNFALGALTRTESGQTRGWQWWASGLGGYWFTYNAISHGPFVRLTYQEDQVKGFAETGNDSTALQYGVQKRKSFISDVGWQVTGQVGAVRPWARVSWEHEAKNDERFVTATPVLLAGTYQIPTITPDDNWVRYTVGASMDFGRVTGYLVGSGTSSKQDGNGYSVTLGVRIPL
jgi:outer membrane lipase/esterase